MTRFFMQIRPELVKKIRLRLVIYVNKSKSGHMNQIISGHFKDAEDLVDIIIGMAEESKFGLFKFIRNYDR